MSCTCVVLYGCLRCAGYVNACSLLQLVRQFFHDSAKPHFHDCHVRTNVDDHEGKCVIPLDPSTYLPSKLQDDTLKSLLFQHILAPKASVMAGTKINKRKPTNKKRQGLFSLRTEISVKGGTFSCSGSVNADVSSSDGDRDRELEWNDVDRYRELVDEGDRDSYEDQLLESNPNDHDIDLDLNSSSSSSASTGTGINCNSTSNSNSDPESSPSSPESSSSTAVSPLQLASDIYRGSKISKLSNEVVPAVANPYAYRVPIATGDTMSYNSSSSLPHDPTAVAAAASGSPNSDAISSRSYSNAISAAVIARDRPARRTATAAARSSRDPEQADQILQPPPKKTKTRS